MRNLETIIGFYMQSQLDRFVVLGGEPTLNPDFKPMIDRILQEDFKAVVIFTNGLMPDDVLTYLSNHDDPRVGIALNLNNQADHSPAEWTQVNNTMKALGKRIGLGINIYHSGQDYDYIIEAIDEYGLHPHVRAGLTHPVVGSKNIYARQDDFEAIAEDLVGFAEKAFRKDINFSFDCGFQFCMFSLDQHKALLRFGIKFRSECTPIIDIGPDLNVWRCFPLMNDVAGHLNEFSGRKKIIDAFDKKYKSLQRMGNKMECPQCMYRRNGLCSGGCLARTFRSFHR
jgi:cyclic pyranopterin phosphate synthase